MLIEHGSRVLMRYLDEENIAHISMMNMLYFDAILTLFSDDELKQITENSK